MRTKADSQAGFALPLALFTIAIVAILLASTGNENRVAARMAAQVAERSDGATAAYSVEQWLIKELLTSAVDRSGLHVGVAGAAASPMGGPPPDMSNSRGLIRLDGTACLVTVGSREMLLRVRDTAGLIDLNSASYATLKRMFESLGVSTQNAGPYAERLLDFTHYVGPSDNIKRLNGASTADYRRAGLPLPTHSPLRSIEEAQGVMGFADDALLWRSDGGLASIATVAGLNYVNPNTAPQAALMAAFGLSSDGAARVIAARSSAPISSAYDLQLAAGEPSLVSDGFEFGTLPSRNVLVEVEDVKLKVSWYSTIVVTPEGRSAPYETIETRVGRPSQGSDDQSAEQACPMDASLSDQR